VDLVETLFIKQTLAYFAFLFQKKLLILNNFELFLETFAEVFEEYDKIRWATTKIRSYRQGSRSPSVYVSNFIQLAYDINWDD